MTYTNALLTLITSAYDYAEELRERAVDNEFIEGYPSEELHFEADRIEAALSLISAEPTLEFLGEAVRHFIPTADWAEDNDGQLVIYTNLRLDSKGNLVLI